MRLFFSCLLLGNLLAATTLHAQSMEDDILQLINKHRHERKLQPLQFDNEISDKAKEHSKDMAKGRVPFGHDGFDDRLRDLMSKLPGSNAGAENVAYGSVNAAEVVDMWLHSPGHKKNIEGRYNLTGIGIARGKNGTLYFTQIFINQRR
jgi:uncharacterized protein YkwD